MSTSPRTKKAPDRELAKAHDPQVLSKLFEQLPPHAIEAEMSLLGSILIDPQVLGDVVLSIKSGDDFFKPANGAIFDVIVHLYDTTSSLDLVQLNQTLIDRNILKDVGGLEYLVELAGSVPSAANAKHYARLVREKAMIRRLIAAAGEILYKAHNAPEDARSILDQAEQAIFQIAQSSTTSEHQTLRELIQDAMMILETMDGRAVTGVPTGFIELDQLTCGLQPSELIILAARPSMGKTAFALNIAENMAIKDIPVAVFSLEMSKQQLAQRLLSSRSGIDLQELRRGIPSRHKSRLMTACDELKSVPMLVDDSPGLSLLQLRAKARRMVSKHGIRAVLIDYLQLLSVGGRVESRQVEVSEISRGLKAMARELNLPVICLSQLNRSPDQREGHRPRLSDLRESGSIEQDADVVCMLHREDYFHQGDEDWLEKNYDKRGVAELIVAKQRNGPTGTIKLSWISSSARFRDYTAAAPPPGVVVAPQAEQFDEDYDEDPPF